MRILVRMPNWLGDAVMSTPALANLVRHFRGADVILVGSSPVADMFRSNPAFREVVADTSKSWRFRPVGIWQVAASIRRAHHPFDLAVAFPNSLSSSLLMQISGARRRVGANGGPRNLLLTDRVTVDTAAHQAEIYNQVVNGYLGTDYPTGRTALYVPERRSYERKTVGINPGAAYGSAKRWEPARFAEVGVALSRDYDLVIFGSAQDAQIAGQIETVLRRRGITRFQNMAGRISIAALLSMMAGLDLFITNDSGPMHIAGAFRIPTVAIFGSTNHVQTCAWRNDRSTIVRRDLPCSPCMKRTCPLKHHACMKEIHPDEVVDAARSLEG